LLNILKFSGVHKRALSSNSSSIIATCRTQQAPAPLKLY
jgi:hypothetical protein